MNVHLYDRMMICATQKKRLLWPNSGYIRQIVVTYYP